jgi:hypothetical protein
MVSESTLRILQDVGELKLYQQEDKDPGVARVRFGKNTLDQLENPVGYQSEVRRQFSIDSEQTVEVSRKDSKITVNLEETQERDEALEIDDDVVDDEQRESEESNGLERGDTTQSSTSSSSTFIIAQIHNPLSLKSLAKDSVSTDDNNASSRGNSPDSERNLIESVHSSCASLPQ